MMGPDPEARVSRGVLVLTYEFPPTGGAGVQRVAKAVRYLPDFGWSPIVVTALTAWGRPHDESLAAEVAGVPVTRLRPLNAATASARLLAVVKRVIGGGGKAAAGAPRPAAAATHGTPLSTRIARWVAAPDVAAYWARNATREGIRLGREHEVSAVLASGLPLSVLLAGARVARALGVPLVADVRDPWAGNPAYEHLPTQWHRARAARAAQEVLAAADVMTTVSEPIAESLLALGAKRAEVVYNGFDPTEMPARSATTSGPLRVGYMGSFYAGSHEPSGFLQGLAEALDAAPGAVRLTVVGRNPDVTLASAARFGAAEAVDAPGYLPHAQALERMAACDVGLVVLNDEAASRVAYPAKVFEYLGMGLPVLAVGPIDGTTAVLVRSLDAGLACEDTPSAVAAALRALAAAKAAGDLPLVPREKVARFERQRQTQRLAGLLDEVAGGTHA